MKRFDNYPFWIVLLSNLLSIIIYGLGFYIMFRLSWMIAVVYLLYILAQEVRLIRNHCTSCFYYGKTCGFGKGRLSALIFKQGDPAKFCQNNFTWKDLIPDILVWTLPILVGIVVLILQFSLSILLAMILLFLFSSFGNQFIRGSLTCKYCKQMELGCPAEQLFNK